MTGCHSRSLAVVSKMRDALLVRRQDGMGRPAAGVVGRSVGVWPVRTYLLVIVVAGALGLPIALIGYAAGQLQVAALVAVVPFALLILWKPEIGVFLLVAYMPFEYYGRLSPVFTLTKVLGLFTFASVLFHLPAARRWRLREGAFWWAMAYLVWALLSVLWATSAEYAWFRLLTQIQLVGLLFIVLNTCQDEEQVKAYYWALFLGAALAAVAAFGLTPSVEEEWQIARATVGERGAVRHAKDLLSAIFLFPVVLLFLRRWLRLLVLIAFLIVLVDLVRTGSRSIYIAAFIGAVAAVLCYRRIGMGRRIAYAVLLTVAVVAFVALGSVTGLWTPRLWERVVEVWEGGLETGGRLWMWKEAFLMGAAEPFTGVGFGNFAFERTHGPLHAHNDFLAQFAELGIPGLLLYVGFLVTVFVRGWRVSHPVVRSAMIGLFVAAVVGSMANPSFARKSFWPQMSAIVLASTIAIDTRRTAASSVKVRRPPVPSTGHL